MNVTLPEKLLDQWDSKEEADTAAKYAQCARGALAYSFMTDMALAWEVSQLHDESADLDVVAPAAAQRIRWLSAHLAVEVIRRKQTLDALKSAEAAMAKEPAFNAWDLGPGASLKAVRAAIAEVEPTP